MATQSRIAFLVSTVASVLVATPPETVAPRSRPSADPPAQVTIADVRRVAAREVKPTEAYRILRRAAANENREMIEPLKATVEAWGDDPDYASASYLALHCLWQLGEPRAYFLGHLDRYRDRTWLAHYAILVLGRYPDDVLMERLKPIEADIRQRDWDNRLWNAMSQARRAREVSDTYGKLADAGQRIDLLLKHAGSTWNPIAGKDSDPIDMHSPVPFWARKELTRLS